MVQGWTVFLARRGQHGLTLTSSLKNGAAHYFKLLSNLWFANALQSLGAAPGALPPNRISLDFRPPGESPAGKKRGSVRIGDDPTGALEHVVFLSDLWVLS